MLKLIALITMIIDHIGYFWDIDVFRIIGRVSFPIYCFLVSQGVKKTRNIKKYMIRLLLLAIVSQCIWKYTGSDVLNVLFTYFLFAQTIYFMKNKSYVLASIIIMVSLLISPMLDYGVYGFALLIMFYYIDDLMVIFILMTGCTVYFIYYRLLSNIMLFALISLLLIKKYDKSKYYKKFKKYNKLFYIAYPLHLIVLFELYKLTLIK